MDGKTLVPLNETVLLAMLDGFNILYLFHFECSHAIRMRSDIGVRKQALCTGEGQVMMAFQDPEQIEAALAAGIEPRTAYSITDPNKLREKLQLIRQQGYVVDDQESELGMRCIAAPIFNSEGSVVASVGLAGPIHRMGDEELKEFIPHVVDAAQQISARLGYR